MTAETGRDPSEEEVSKSAKERTLSDNEKEVIDEITQQEIQIGDHIEVKNSIGLSRLYIYHGVRRLADVNEFRGSKEPNAKCIVVSESSVDAKQFPIVLAAIKSISKGGEKL
ncbi:MAG TPA: hypothetical protein VJC11_03555 [Patescibacteria group bacterium]|nr:hypothetical protein [Patescibacteria group bacterium]